MTETTLSRKEILIEKLLDGSISSSEIDELMLMLNKIEFRNFIKRIFDMNESSIINDSKAESGLMGLMNRIGKYIKNNNIKRRLDKANYRTGKKLIIAEGDSWFEFPIFLNDIIDWIIKDKTNPVYSLAFGGDWIANIIYEEEYIIELSTYQPEIFLISGGGNDLVGDGRVSLLVNKPSLVDFKVTPDDAELLNNIIKQNFGNGEIDSQTRAEMIVRGKKYLNQSFWGLIKVFEIMYKIVFRSIALSGKFSDMKIITQGYDFAIPSNNTQIFVNPLRWALHNGQWLYYPLVRKGISDTYEQQCILSGMIYYFNEMLIEVGDDCNRKNGSSYIYHIDSRGALKKNEWADELHPFSKSFKRISNVYLECIKGNPPRNSSNPVIYPVRNYR